MKLYRVNPNYTAFLHAAEPNVHYCTDPSKNLRPYVLAMVSIRQSPAAMPFLVPLTSSFHREGIKRHQSRWERTITDPGDPTNELGMMLFNKMIPVPTDKSLMTEIIIEQESESRQKILKKEKEYLDAFEGPINEQASCLYKMRTYMKQELRGGSNIEKICVNYEKLQKLSSSYSPASASLEASTSDLASTSTSLSAPAIKRAKAKAKKEEAERKAK